MNINLQQAVDDAEKAVEEAEQKVKNADQKVKDAQTEYDKVQNIVNATALTKAQTALTEAQTALTKAQTELANAQSQAGVTPNNSAVGTPSANTVASNNSAVTVNAGAQQSTGANNPPVENIYVKVKDLTYTILTEKDGQEQMGKEKDETVKTVFKMTRTDATKCFTLFDGNKPEEKKGFFRNPFKTSQGGKLTTKKRRITKKHNKKLRPFKSRSKK